MGFTILYMSTMSLYYGWKWYTATMSPTTVTCNKAFIRTWKINNNTIGTWIVTFCWPSLFGTRPDLIWCHSTSHSITCSHSTSSTPFQCHPTLSNFAQPHSKSSTLIYAQLTHINILSFQKINNLSQPSNQVQHCKNLPQALLTSPNLNHPNPTVSSLF